MLSTRNGVYVVDITLPNGRRVRKSLKTRDKDEANRRAGEALQKALQASQNDSSGVKTKEVIITLREAYRRAMRDHDGWRDSKAPGIIQGHYNTVVEYFGQDADLAEIKFEDVQTFVSYLIDEEELSGGTVNHKLSFISVLIDTATEVWKLPIVPYKMPRRKTRSGRMRIVSKEEEEKILKYWTEQGDQPMYDLIVALLATGSRLSEMLNLDVTKDVSWERNAVMIWENKADHPVQKPMTKKLRIILNKAYIDGLKNPFGGMDRWQAAKKWAKMRGSFGLSHDTEFVLHALRHTTASRLAAAGTDSFRLQAFMGHKNISTTQKYVKLFGSDLKDLAGVLE